MWHRSECSALGRREPGALPAQQQGCISLSHWAPLLPAPQPFASPSLCLPFTVSFQKSQGNFSLIFDGLATMFYSTMYITLPIWICKMVKIQPPEKITWKEKKIIRQLRMAIIHSYLCFGKEYCPRELAPLITLSSVWGRSEPTFHARRSRFPAAFLSVIKTNARLLIELDPSWGSHNLYIRSWATKLTKHMHFFFF